MIEQKDALQKIKELPDNSQDIIFMDPPYGLGSEIFIDKDGKVKYKSNKDFMDKWDMPDHNFWEEFFVESKRVLKYGGRLLMFGMDRQLLMFEYYGVKSGLEIRQSLYWYFLSNFPKATDASKMIDKKLGSEIKSELGKKYEGYKYSVSPLKQVLETIIVFQKETKNKSTLDDIFAYENGDNEISPSVWAIDNGKIPLENGEKEIPPKQFNNDFKDVTNLKSLHNVRIGLKKEGRYPAQMFIEDDMAKDLMNKQVF